jgi:dihydrofolate synthase/folylpolyglutamate synthase
MQMATYQETIEYMYARIPLFQMVGSAAYKEGLESMMDFDERLGHPHRSFRCIHVGGTNGKGSTSHTIASILQSSGLKVGLFTSPHLKDFRERIRVNGEVVPEQFVIDFVAKHKSFIEEAFPSFFEVCVAMAFDYFRQEAVDVAVVEVGLGGRLDSTNIISPELCVITNISIDHTNILGETELHIAKEKSGIIKEGVPVVIGEAVGEIRALFESVAAENNAPIYFADEYEVEELPDKDSMLMKLKVDGEVVETPLGGIYQRHNMATVKCSVRRLRELGYAISEEVEQEGYRKTIEQTHLLGRWQKIGENPTIICDTGHNVGGVQYVVEQLRKTPHEHLHIVFGMVGDKDVSNVLELLPKEATYYFTKAGIKRAMDEKRLKSLAEEKGLRGESYRTVNEALLAAKKNSVDGDLIYVGGSTYIVAEVI